MTETTTPPPRPLLNPTTLALPLASGAAYGLAYCYELGYTETFRIPRGVVTVSLADFLLAAFWSAVFLFAIWMWMCIAAAIGTRASSRIGKHFWVSISVIGPAFCLAVLTLRAGYWVASLVILGAILLAIVVAAVETEAPDVASKINSWPMLVVFNRLFSAPIAGIQRIAGRHAGEVVLALVLAGTSAFMLGRSHALTPDSYVKVTGYDDYFVLRTYREHVVLLSLDPKTGIRGETLVVLGWSDVADKPFYRVPRTSIR